MMRRQVKTDRRRLSPMSCCSLLSSPFRLRRRFSKKAPMGQLVEAGAAGCLPRPCSGARQGRDRTEGLRRAEEGTSGHPRRPGGHPDQDSPCVWLSPSSSKAATCVFRRIRDSFSISLYVLFFNKILEQIWDVNRSPGVVWPGCAKMLKSAALLRANKST